MIDAKTALMLNIGILVIFLSFIAFLIFKKKQKDKIKDAEMRKELNTDIFSAELRDKYSVEAIKARMENQKNNNSTTNSVYIEPQKEKMKRLAEEKAKEHKEE